ncbi:MAG TPA: tetratricopeptide repeat protein, partial [Planctomycetaceae bacterium]|nr:tetratricopeptide repeat protein [Planctomycetaceae bacterium]
MPVNSLQVALRHYQSGNIAEASRQLSDLVKSEPAHAEAWHLLGLIDFATGNLTDAVKHFHQAVKLERSAKYLTNLGSAWHALGETREAADCFEQAVTANPHHAEARTYLGIIRLQQGRLDDAEACFQAALLDNPKETQALLNLGNVFHERSQLDQAAEQYERALSCDPDYAEALLNLGAVRFNPNCAQRRERKRLLPCLSDWQSVTWSQAGGADDSNSLSDTRRWRNRRT